MNVIAESVETCEQQAHLSALNCEYRQGYHFSKPMDSRSAEAMLGDVRTGPCHPTSLLSGAREDVTIQHTAEK
jgi:predicted signal transduction protein with EAL and GGDEF domain